MAHRVAQINVLNRPPMTLKFVHNHPMEILRVYRVITAQSGGIVVEDDGLIPVLGIVVAEVLHQGR